MEYEGWSIFAFRTVLGIGIYISHRENDTIVGEEEDGTLKTYLFDGLHILLPFFEIRWGTIWQPVIHTPVQEEDQAKH